MSFWYTKLGKQLARVIGLSIIFAFVIGVGYSVKGIIGFDRYLLLVILIYLIENKIDYNQRH